MEVWYYKRYNAKTGELDFEGTAQQIADAGHYKDAETVSRAARGSIATQNRPGPKIHRWERFKVEMKAPSSLVEGWDKPRKKVCECGEVFMADNARVRLCPRCREIRRDLSRIKSRERKLIRQRKAEAEKAGKDGITLDEAVKMATAAGMSYGMWMIKRRIAQ